MLREPADMLYSLYHELRYLGDEHLPTFQQALAAEEDRRAGKGICRSACFGQGLIYHEAVRYAGQVQRYFNIFGRQWVHVIVYDDLVNHPARVYRDTLEFLEVDPSYRPADFKIINGNKCVRSPALRAIVKEPLLHSTMAGVRPWLPRKLVIKLRQLGSWLWGVNTRFTSRPLLDPGLRWKLRAEFAPEIERLSELLGRDLTHWSK